MITSFLNTMQEALCADFPGLSTHDASCMLLGGMGNVQTFDLTTFNAIMASYNLTTTDVYNTYMVYKNGNGGSCGLN